MSCSNWSLWYALVFALVIGSPSSVLSSGYGNLECPYPYTLSGTTCLFLPDCTDTDLQLSWAGSRTYCQTMVGGGDLATFMDTCHYEDLIKFLNVKLDPTDECDLWIGASEVTEEGAFEIINTDGMLLGTDEPFWSKPIATTGATDQVALLSDAYYRLGVVESGTTPTPLCQIKPHVKSTPHHRAPIYIYPVPIYIEQEAAPVVAASGGGGSGGGDTTNITVEGSNFSSDNTASFSSAPAITVNTHHHHVEKHPKVIIIPTYNPPPHENPSQGYGDQGYGGGHSYGGHRAPEHHNDPHIVVSYDPHDEHVSHADTPEHAAIDANIHPSGVSYHPSEHKRLQLRKKKRPSAQSFHIGEGRINSNTENSKLKGPMKKIQSIHKKYIQKTAENQELEPSDPGLIPIQGRHSRPIKQTSGSADQEQTDLIGQLLSLIDKIGIEVPYESRGLQDKTTSQTERLYNEEKKYTDHHVHKTYRKTTRK